MRGWIGGDLVTTTVFMVLVATNTNSRRNMIKKLANCHTIVFKTSAQIPCFGSKWKGQPGFIKTWQMLSSTLRPVHMFKTPTWTYNLFCAAAPKQVFTESFQQNSHVSINGFAEKWCEAMPVEQIWMCLCFVEILLFVLCRDIIVFAL